jgi:glycosyltransferase involved in cell wall biosynthesis
MRVAIVNNFARVTGGADSHCLDLAVALRRRGHEVAFLATKDSRNIEGQGAFISCHITRETRDSVKGTAAARVAARSFWNQEAARAMRTLAREFEPDLVHVHKIYPQLSVAPVVIARRLGLPVVQTVHDYELISASALDDKGSVLDRRESSFRYRALNDATFPIRRLVHVPRVQRWVAVSRSVAGHLATKGITAEVIPNFVQPPWDRAPETDRRGVAYVGRLSPEKGVLHVLEVAATLPQVEITIAGDGPLAGMVSSRASALANLHYAGPLRRDQVVEVMARSLAILIPSLWEEPGGITALEAASTGTPVIAYRHGGLAEYVEQADSGLVIEPSQRRLREAILELSEDEARWRRLSAAGPTAIAERHSPDRCVGMYEEVYASVAHR